VTDFGLVCDNVAKVQLLQIGVMMGVFVGAIGFGRMSDVSGRRPCIMWSLITCFTGMLLSSFVPGSKI